MMAELWLNCYKQEKISALKMLLGYAIMNTG